MKIGLFFDTYYPQKNGVATSGVYLTQALRQKGHQVIVVVPGIKGHKDSDKDILRIPSINTIPNLPESIAIRMPVPKPDKIWKKVFGQNYDVIHADGNGFFSLLGLFVARRKKVPYILTSHTVLKHYTHHFMGGKVVTPKIINYGLKIFGNKCDGIIVPSKKMKDELIQIGVKKPITVIPSFIDLDKFNIQKSSFLHDKYHIPKKDKIILSVGRLEKEKNFEFLIKVFSETTKQFPDVHLVIAGEGSNRKNLDRLITGFGLGKQVHLIGDVDMNLMPYVYHDADIFLFASYSETQGLCVLEAISSGLPLVLCNDTAYEGMIIDCKNGFSLPLDQKKFTDKIKLLLSDKNLRKQFGENSRKIAKTNFEKDTLVNRLINLYKKYISEYNNK